jgi:hypothetical protein
MAISFQFHRRFGGQLSLEQQLKDLTRALPAWAQPLWSLALRWILPWLRDLQIKATMADVEQQAQAMADQWQAEAQLKQLTAAAEVIQQQNPEAKVAVVPIPGSPLNAIAVEYPPSPHDAAQQALGFGAIEIRSPWTVAATPEP